MTVFFKCRNWEADEENRSIKGECPVCHCIVAEKRNPFKAAGEILTCPGCSNEFRLIRKKAAK